MPNNELEEFSRALWRSLELADRLLIEEKASRGEKLAYGTLDGKIIHIEARDLLRILSQNGNRPTTHSKSDD